ncbi:tetratricopeptide repeat protein [Parablastomonas sp. CN1-191]|uniref:tetratricopeptide repeat protein n=1 Tax=Parablastomonas sp. CN1-191 TaxID=3400908 RepID=UPI003BF804C4
MTVNRIRRLILPLGLAGVAAAAMIAGSSVVAAPKADELLAKAQDMLRSGKTDKAIAMVEAAVAANPGDPAYRATLGAAYLRAGRFDSAATALSDALTLGDSSARTALSLALAQVALGHDREAVAVLDDWRDAIPAEELGLALALAGQGERGVAVLTGAVRDNNSVKARQNLAYAYALAGEWRGARIAMAQDVAPDQIDNRIGQWAEVARPEDFRLRVARLIGVPLVTDPGQPSQLALNVAPAAAPVLAQAAPAAQPGGELPALAAAQPMAPVAVPAPVQVAEAAPVRVALPEVQPAAAAPVASGNVKVTFVSVPVIQALPMRSAQTPIRTAAVPVRARVALAPVHPRNTPVRAGNHMVQLGSFSSEAGARRSWALYTAKSPSLKNYRMALTTAQVNGRTYWRVAAAGLDPVAANGACSRIKAGGGMCFAYAAPKSAPAVATRGRNEQLAAR